MAIFDKTHDGYRVFVGDLASKVSKYELEKEFEYWAPVSDVWVARNPPGFAFVVFKHSTDAEKVVREMDGRYVCGRRVRVEHAKPYEMRGRQRQADRSRTPPRRRSSGFRSRSPERRWSRSRSRDRRRSRSRDRLRSRSRDRRRSRSRDRRRSRSRDRRRSRSRDRRRSRSRERRSRSRDRKSRSRDQRRSKSDDRGRSRSGSRNRSRSKDKSDDKDRQKNNEKDRKRRDSDRNKSSERARSRSASPVPEVNHNGNTSSPVRNEDMSDKPITDQTQSNDSMAADNDNKNVADQEL